MIYKKNNYHPTAIVDDGAEIGDGTKIWHWAHICGGAKIGKNCSIGQNVFIGNDVKIGDNVKIQNNVSIYDKVILEDNVFCGPSAVFTNVKNPRSEISRKNEYKQTLVRQGVTLGANSTIICGIEIGKYSFIGAGSVLTKSTLDFSLMIGNPAKILGWMSAFGEKIPLPLSGEGEWICKNQKKKYVLKGDKIFCN